MVRTRYLEAFGLIYKDAEGDLRDGGEFRDYAEALALAKQLATPGPDGPAITSYTIWGYGNNGEEAQCLHWEA